MDDRYHVESDLLLDVLYGLNRCFHHNEMKGGILHNSDPYVSMARGFLEFVALSAMGAHKLSDSLLCTTRGVSYFRDYIPERLVYDAIDDFKKMYAFIQEKIKTVLTVKDGKIRLNRRLTEYEVRSVLPQYLVKERKDIELPVNTLTFFSYDRMIGEYQNRGVSLKINIDVADIVYVDCLLDYKRSPCKYRNHFGETEVMVIDRSIYNRVLLPRESFEVDIEKIKSEFPNLYNNAVLKMNEYESDEFGKKLDYYQEELAKQRFDEEFLPPCRRDRITKWLIDRNVNKMKSKKD